MSHRLRVPSASQAPATGRPRAAAWQAQGLAIRLCDYAPNRVMPSHAHGVLGISVVLRGSVEETAGRAVVEAGAASAVIKPAGTVHANRFGPAGARLLSVELAPTRAAGLLDDAGSLDHWRWFRVTRALGVASRALLDLSESAPPPGDAMEHLAVELVAALGGDADEVRGSPPSWLRAVRERLEDAFEQPCLVRDLAREAGVHPVYLARRFRQHYGVSVLDYLRGVRVRAAVRALADAETPLTEVALSTGFSDQSHLTRVLRATTGLTPRKYRRLTGLA